MGAPHLQLQDTPLPKALDGLADLPSRTCAVIWFFLQHHQRAIRQPSKHAPLPYLQSLNPFLEVVQNDFQSECLKVGHAAASFV